jgi:hypothetical protein
LLTQALAPLYPACVYENGEISGTHLPPFEEDRIVKKIARKYGGASQFIRLLTGNDDFTKKRLKLDRYKEGGH